MLFLLGWIIYGLIVGTIAKFLYRGAEPAGLLSTIGVGIVGSYIGGLIHYLLGRGMHPFSPSGIVFGVIGGIVFCWVYGYFKLNRFLEIKKFGKFR